MTRIIAHSSAARPTRTRYFGPYDIARFGAVAGIVFCALFVWLSLLAPRSEAALVQTGAQTVRVTAPGQVFDMDPAATVRFSGPEGQMALPAMTLADPEGPLLEPRMRLADLLRDAPVTARAVDAGGAVREFSASRRPGRLEDLTGAYWVAMVCGLAGMLFGFGVWVMRPRDWAAGWFGVIGALLLASSATDSLAELWNIATPLWFVLVTETLNAAVLQPFAIGFVALFARFPNPLIPWRPLRILLGLFFLAGAGAVVATPIIGYGPHGALQAAEYLTVLVLVGAQFWSGRSDPAQRPALIILLVSIGLGTALYLLTTILPTMRGVARPLAEVIALPVFTLIYCGIGVAIVRTSMLAMEGWVRSLMLSASFLIAVLLIDIGLIGLFTRQQDVALGLSFAAAALIYFPVREWLSRRVERRRTAQIHLALRLATDLAFATNEAERAERWRAAVEATFQPLEAAGDPDPVAAPCVAERGAALRLPAIAGAPGLVCRHAGGGRRAFTRADEEAADALIGMVRRLVAARDAYVAGATEERGRIARDLHDDVSGRLMTSLHRADAGAMRQDVREAMADIRTIVTGLAGKPRLLGELLADLRHECAGRCEAAGVALHWPPGPELSDARPLPYAAYRHLAALMRECVSNIVRHSGAARASVAIDLTGETLTARIADDGKGLTGEAADGGHGLRNCAQRAVALGGAFAIGPRGDGPGCVAEFSVRLAPAEAGAEAGETAPP